MRVHRARCYPTQPGAPGADVSQSRRGCGLALRCSFAVAVAVLLAGCGGSARHDHHDDTAAGKRRRRRRHTLRRRTTIREVPRHDRQTAVTARTARRSSTSSGRREPAAGSLTLDLDLKLVGQGRRGHGRRSTALTFDIVRIGQKAYFKGDAEGLLEHSAGRSSASAAERQLDRRRLRAPRGSGDRLRLAAPNVDAAVRRHPRRRTDRSRRATNDDDRRQRGDRAHRLRSTGATLYVATTGPAVSARS